MPIVERLFSKISPTPPFDSLKQVPISAFLNRPAIVVLGDPGSGKTTSFEQASALEPNAVFVSVRDFLSLSSRRWRGKTLFLDGLDEQRAKSADGTSILDRIREKLDELGCPRFRLSCRAADWYGASDADSLSLVSPDNTVTVIMLEPLTERAILTIASEVVADAKAFIEEARHRGIDELLVNPQTLILLLAVIQDGPWPQTRLELFQRACDVLGREPNEIHRRVSTEGTDPESIINNAGYLCAIQLCGGVAGIALDEGNASADFPYLGRLRVNLPICNISVRRRLFRMEGPERVTPAHRTIAEYLAARHMVGLIRAGFPIGRILSLLTGYDGGTLSDLRGLYAWLACLCPEHAGSLIPRDPIGVVLYGDTTPLPSDLKMMILDNLWRTCDKNPWFREDWASTPFGGLCSPEMEPRFQAILTDPSQHPVFVSCVIDAIRHGQPLPGLRDPLLDIVRDETRAGYLREEAIDAFRHVRPEETTTLVELLDDIQAGRVQDENHQLRGALLTTLYPSVIQPHEIIKYIIAEREFAAGDYGRFVDFDMIDVTPESNIPILLDLIAKSGLPCLNQDKHTGRRFIGRLLGKGLRLFGEELQAERLFHWLGIAVDKYDHSMLDRNESQSIKDWLTSHIQIVKDLYDQWLGTTLRKNMWYEEHRFWKRLQDIVPPGGFPRWQLQKAATETDDQIAEFLFRMSVRFLTTTEREDSPTLDELFAYVDLHPRFKKFLETELYDEIPEWRVTHALRAIEQRQKKADVRSTNIRIFSDHLETIRTGQARGWLADLARVYFGRFIDVDHDAPPTQRLLTETNAEISSAALEGFVATLRIPKGIPSPKKISLSQTQGKYFTFGHVAIAGMDLLAERSIAELMALPDATLKSALAFYHTNHTGQNHPWVDSLVMERPDLAAEALRQFWEPQLSRRLQHISGIDDLDIKVAMAKVAEKIAIPLLRKYPDCAEAHLEHLLRAALKHADRDAFLKLIRSRLKLPTVKGERLALWISFGFLLAPEEFKARLSKHIGKKTEKAWHVLGVVNIPLRPDGTQIVILSPISLGYLIKTIARTFSPSDRPTGATDHGFNSEAHAVKGLIARLRDDTGTGAGEVLASLHDDVALKAWREDLVHALDIQARKRREEKFKYPSVAMVVKTLLQGPPANPPDLQALVAKHLRVLGEEIIHGPTDGYKTFWNVDRYGRPISPRPENDCRDRILDHLRPILARQGVNAEPEGHYARDKRSDIKILFASYNLPVEIKRHYHSDLWAAPIGQLQNLYTQDPGTGGRGIYLVLWFGRKKKVKGVPRPPAGIRSPRSAAELERALQQNIPEEDRVAIDVIVFDCSG